MSHGYTARATWALEVPPGDILIPIDQNLDVPVSIKVSMAAIDPTLDPIIEEGDDKPRIPRSTLKIVRLPPIMDDDSEEDELTEDQLEELRALIGDGSDDSDDSEDDEPKAGPSNSKGKGKGKGKAGVKKLTEALKGTADDSDEDMEDAKPNGVKKNKGKAPATESDDESDIESDVDEEGEPEISVICTLDTERNYQQPLDIIIPTNENIGFIVSGTHAVHLTGNLVTHFEDDESDDGEDASDEEDYDLEPDSDELLEGESDEESDVLDGQRITEVDTDEEEEAPKLVAVAPKKGSKKRPAEDEAENLDDMMKAEEKLSKKQLKKMKTNKGEAVSTKEDKADKKKEDAKAEKKVQFAKNLEQGPTGSEAKKADQKKATTSSVTVVKGVKIDDRKVGQGRKVKNGDKVGVRYIGKLENGKQFDANKKGPPFTFKVGKGEVIKGWEIGVQGMAVGGERRLVIPASQAYGSASVPGIPPNSTLVFDIKLLEIK